MEMTGNLLKSFYAERKIWLEICISCGVDLSKLLFFKGLLKANVIKDKLREKASEAHREVRVTFHPAENKEDDVLL